MNDSDLRGIGFTSQRTRDRLVSRLREAGISDEKVLQVVAEVPRHIFVEEALSHRAYEDTALPIGHGQTISQPYVVARMTEALLQDGVPGRVLELGTGSGYQTAVLARLVGQVYSVERIRPLLDRARKALRLLGLRNVQLRHADGGIGMPEQAPFDAIIVTAAPRTVPDALIEQLAPGGRLIIPVGDGEVQELRCIRRTDSGIEQSLIEYVRFVPLLGGVVR